MIILKQGMVSPSVFKNGLEVAATGIVPINSAICTVWDFLFYLRKSIEVRMDYQGGTGIVDDIDSDENVIRFRAHHEGEGGWSQV